MSPWNSFVAINVLVKGVLAVYEDIESMESEFLTHYLKQFTSSYSASWSSITPESQRCEMSINCKWHGRIEPWRYHGYVWFICKHVLCNDYSLLEVWIFPLIIEGVAETIKRYRQENLKTAHNSLMYAMFCGSKTTQIRFILKFINTNLSANFH